MHRGEWRVRPACLRASHEVGGLILICPPLVPPLCPLTLPKGMEFTKKRLSFSLRKRGCSFSFTMKMTSAGMMLGPWAGGAKG